MNKTIKIGIIICDRYRNCGGGKCFRSLKNRDGAFSIYNKNDKVEIVGYSTCGSCPGGNIEYVINEMKNNGAEIIHLATGFVVGYPPCPYIKFFKKLIEVKHGLKVVIGTHPIPQKYWIVHTKLGTWKSKEWKEIIKPTMADEKIRLLYD
jgi:predicted metal-binding protein